MAAGTYSFEGVCVDRSRMTVERDGVAISLEPKAMDVLLFLLAHRDRLVTKDELLDAVWKDTFVTPNVLTRAVAQLRKALGDDAQEARIIGTVSKRGYRFIATVVEIPAGESPAGVSTPEVAAPVASAAPIIQDRSLPQGKLWRALLIVLIIGIAAALWTSRVRSVTPAPAVVAATRFTTRQGYDGQPAVSPDGRSVVYVSDRSGSLELYETGLTMGAPDVALTSNGGRNIEPEWSPDGKWIAFRSERLGGIWIVAAAGGPPQQIVDFGSDPSWSADSEQLVFASNGISTATPSEVWTVRRDGTDRKVLKLAQAVVGKITMPAWSHNGRFIAFALNNGNSFQDVWVASTDGRILRKLADGLTGSDIRWAPNDDGLFWGGQTDARLSRLVRLEINSDTGQSVGTPQAILPVDGGRIDGLSIAADGRALFGIAITDSNLWQIALRGGTVGEPARLTNDAVRTSFPPISVDGHLAFGQLVEGRPPLAWLMASAGTQRIPLLSSGSMQGAQWSRDGRRMFVVHNDAPVWVDVETRRSTPIPIRLANPFAAQLASDDSGVLSHRGGPGGVINVWFTPFDGSPDRQMTFDPEGASYAVQSPDGRWIAVQLTRGVDTWIGVMAAQPGAAIVPLVKARGQSWLYTWAPGSDRIPFAGERDGVWNIFDVERVTGVVRQLTHWSDHEGYVRYPAWSPLGDRVVFERSMTTSSLWTAKLW